MKAAILEKLNSPLVIDDLELLPLEFGQVLVEVHASGICGAQIGEIAGRKGPDPYLPHLLGHEGGGIVKDFGPGITQVTIGDHVVMGPRKGLGLNSPFPRYRRNNNTFIGGGLVTTFNEFAVVSENRLTVIDKNIPFDVAALMGCAVTTGLGIVFNDAKLKFWQSIAVVGCGGVGLNIIQGAKLSHARSIIAIDITDEKMWLAEKMGANGFINVKDDPDGLRFIDEFDVIVDTTGNPNLIAKAYKLVAPGGKMIMVGQIRHGQDLIIPNIVENFEGKILMDSQGGQTNPNIDIPRYLDLYRRGLLKLDELITHRFKFDQVNEALDVVRSGKAGRVILEMK